MGGNAFTTFPVSAGAVGGWVELDRTTLGVAGSDIEVTGLANKRYYQFLLHILGTSAGIDMDMRLGNSTFDTANNYAYRRANDGAELTTANANHLRVSQNAGTDNHFFINGYLANLSAVEKFLQSWCNVAVKDAGGGTAPNRCEFAGKWVNTSNPLDRIKAFHASVNLDAGSELVILGWDPADIHTTNFWEEIASADLTGGASDTLDSGTFSSVKKYIWFQAYLEGVSGTVQAALRVDGDATANQHSVRDSTNGGADATSVNGTNIRLQATVATRPATFVNGFMVNEAAEEKLVIIHSVEQNTAGSGNAPNRVETVGKWVNTSIQADKLQILNFGAGDFGTASFIKVWGSN